MTRKLSYKVATLRSLNLSVEKIQAALDMTPEELIDNLLLEIPDRGSKRARPQDVLPLADGTRTQAEIAAHLGTTKKGIQNAFYKLRKEGHDPQCRHQPRGRHVKKQRTKGT